MIFDPSGRQDAGCQDSELFFDNASSRSTTSTPYGKDDALQELLSFSEGNEPFQCSGTFTPLSLRGSCSAAVENDLLGQYGLTPSDITSIRLLLGFPANLEQIKNRAYGEPIHIRKNKENKLSRSLVFIPEKNGMPAQVFVLLKDNNIEILGEGRWKRVTKALGFIINKDGFLSSPIAEKAFLSYKAKDAVQEIKVMNLLKEQPHCLTTNTVVQYRGNVNRELTMGTDIRKVGLIMDLMEGDFNRISKSLPKMASGSIDPALLSILRDAAQGLLEMHRLKIVHNDVKAPNIAIVQGGGKIADFGLSSPVGQVPVGIVALNPPEVHMRPNNKSNYTSKVDVFQFGMALMATLGYERYVQEYIESRLDCYRDDARIHFFNRFAANIFDRFKNENSSPFVQLISDCVNVNPQKRIDSDELVKRLNRHVERLSLHEALEVAEKKWKANPLTIPCADLKSGAKAPKEVISPIFRVVDSLHKDSYDAFMCLVSICEGNYVHHKEYEKNIAILQESGLVRMDGTVPKFVREVMLSACEDNGFDNRLSINKSILGGESLPFDDGWKDQKFIGSEEMLRKSLHEIEKNLAKLKSLVLEHIVVPDAQEDSSTSLGYAGGRPLKTALSTREQKTAPKGAEQSSSEAKSVSKDRGVWVAAGMDKPKPKPKTIDYKELHFRAGINSEGRPQIGVGAPMHVGGYDFNGSVDIQADTEALKGLWNAISGGKTNPRSKNHKTNFGEYKISWYTMGKAVFSGKEHKQFKVKIKDPDGKTHTLWVKGAYVLEGKINEYLDHLIAKKVAKETQNFSTSFNALVEQKELQAAQSSLDAFWHSYGKYLSQNLLKKHQDFLNVAFVRQRVESLRSQPTDAIVSQVKASARTGVVGYAEYLEQELLKNLLIEKLVEKGSEQELQSAVEALSSVKKGSYIDPTPLKEEPSLPGDKKGFVKMHHSCRREMRERAVKCLDELVTAYKELQAAVRSGKGVQAAEENFKRIYEVQSGGGRHGFGIKLKEGGTYSDWLEKNYPEVVNCYNGKSDWLLNYYEQSKAVSPSLLSEQEVRSLSISINIKKHNEATEILNNPKSTLADCQRALEERYKADKILEERKLTKEDLDPGSDPNFIKASIEHFEWCEGSQVLSNAANAIDKILKPYSETVNGKAQIKIHKITEAERLELRKEGEIIAKSAKRGGKLFEFSKEVLRFNYQVLADSYGKFASLFITNALLEYGQMKESKLLTNFIQAANICLPNVIQDALMVPLALYQGNGQAAVKNLVEGLPSKSTLVKMYKEQKGSLLEMGWKLTATALPFIYDSVDEKNRPLFQKIHFYSSLVSRVQSLVQETSRLSLFTTMPFDVYEFLVEPPDRPENRQQWTLIDTGVNYIHQSLMQVMPNFLQVGNLPENTIYYAAKHFTANLGSAYTVITSGRAITGPHGDNRDVKAGLVYAASMTIFQALSGKFSEERFLAAYKNAQFNLRAGKYLEALPSIVLLQELLQQKSGQKNREVKFAKIELFVMESYFISIHNIARQLMEEQKDEQAQVYIKKIEEAVDTGFVSAFEKISAMLEEGPLEPLHKQAKEIYNKLTLLQISSLALLLNIGAKEERVSVDEEVQKKIEASLKAYPNVRAKVGKGSIKLKGFVKSREDLQEVPSQILSLIDPTYAVEVNLYVDTSAH